MKTLRVLKAMCAGPEKEILSENEQKQKYFDEALTEYV